MKLDLNDLSPKEAKFKLTDLPGKEFTLCRWSLRVRMWVMSQYTEKQVEELFSKHQINDIAKIAYYMLKEKDQFLDEKGQPTLDGFLDRILNMDDIVSVIRALLQSIGIGEPEVKKITEGADKTGQQSDPNVQSPNP